MGVHRGNSGEIGIAEPGAESVLGERRLCCPENPRTSPPAPRGARALFRQLCPVAEGLSLAAHRVSKGNAVGKAFSRWTGFLARTEQTALWKLLQKLTFSPVALLPGREGPAQPPRARTGSRLPARPHVQQLRSPGPGRAGRRQRRPVVCSVRGLVPLQLLSCGIDCILFPTPIRLKSVKKMVG